MFRPPTTTPCRTESSCCCTPAAGSPTARSSTVGATGAARPTSFIVATAKDFGSASRVKTAVEQLRDRHFPVTVRELPKKANDWDDAGAAELLRWIDSLDRI